MEAILAKAAADIQLSKTTAAGNLPAMCPTSSIGAHAPIGVEGSPLEQCIAQIGCFAPKPVPPLLKLL